MTTPRIYVLHENDAWVEPLRAAFQAQRLPFTEWFLDDGVVDLAAAPPEGVFYNRMSASSYTRGRRFAPELTAVTLAWLEGHGRRVVNSSRALELEISKPKQIAALARAGVRTPRTVVVVGRERLVPAARAAFSGPVILKPGRGGRGQGVQLFASVDQLAAWVESDIYEAPVDGVWLLQQYVETPEPFITRAEFIGGRFFYAVRVDTRGGFELCPADVCATEPVAAGDAFCPAEAPVADKFSLLDGIEPALIGRYESFLADNGVEVAGIEFARDGAGVAYAYDVNTNTNYNADAEARAGRAGTETGMGAIARFLGAELRRLYGAAAAAE